MDETHLPAEAVALGETSSGDSTTDTAQEVPAETRKAKKVDFSLTP